VSLNGRKVLIMSKILIVDDDQGVRATLRAILKHNGHEVEEVASGDEAIACMRRASYDLVITDLGLGGSGSGYEVLREARKRPFPPEVIVISAYGTVDDTVRAIKAGAFDFISEPFQGNDVLRKVEAALIGRSSIAWSGGGYELNGLIGRTPAMKEVFDLITQVCKTDCTVLILGESGTGKELVARAIHKNSRRRHMPLITVNCGAIPENLQESELFGHVRGAFTGADRDKIGILQEANGGTVFLDEIGEMSLSTQVKLLRFLQYGEVRRIGENRPVHVDVRLIAATNVDLEEAVENKNFRKDLYYRLNVVAIYLPPLRDRREDIPLLADHFLKRFSQKMEKAINGISPDAMAALMNYDWPGNVRELENAIERAVVLTRSDFIELEDLPPKIRYGSADPYRSPLSRKGNTFRIKDDLTLKEVERAYIVHKLKRCKTYEEAARELGIGRTTLWRKIKRYGITLDEVM